MTIILRSADENTPRVEARSEYDNWGEFDPRAKGMDLERWLIVHVADGVETVVGDMSAHPVYYGPTPTSRALNIGISIVEQQRGKGYGAIAQRMLAELLHERGVLRVEASTDVTNIPEQKALAKAGFKFEGVIRQSQGRADGIHDLQQWSHIAGID
jgi:RimJ/RimL family protein N-acetyltransferase